MQNTEVHKIGGSVLKDPEETHKTLLSLINTASKKLVVVSAIYGVTDIIDEAARNNNLEKRSLKKLKQIHYEWTKSLINDHQAKSRIYKKVNKALAEISKHISFYQANPDPYKLAHILSFGERLSSIILIGALSNLVKSLLTSPEALELKTESHPFSANFIGLNTQKLIRRINANKIIIIPGFYGISKEGNTCLTGRGGSDYTAAFLASKLSVLKLVFWKDTEGVRSADPKFVLKTQPVKRLNLIALCLMEQTGAAIIHPKVTQEIAGSDIAVYFYNPNATNNPVTSIEASEKITERPIIITTANKKHDTGNSQTTITILSRNIPASIILFSRWKNTHSASRIVDYSDHHITFSVPETQKVEATQFFHDGYYISIEDIPANQLTQKVI